MSTAAPLAEPVYVDREMWEKIVLNLISNAFKFTLPGSVAVTVSTRQDERALLAVVDTGVGIPEHELPRVFERFHRVEGAQGRSHEGSGIGLALVQELVKLHGGELTVDSQVGRGSRFTVSMPLGTAHLPADQIGPAGERRSAQRGARRTSRKRCGGFRRPRTPSDSRRAGGRDALPASGVDVGRVLLADDNADMRDYARRLLASAGTSTRSATAVRRWRPRARAGPT